MKALVYHGPGEKAWDTVPDPTIVDPTDAIVQVDTTTICGTDLHILKGDVPAVTEGRILGHEGVGTITEVGAAVSKLAVGDRVIISCITSCGSCSYCHQQLPSHCLDDEGVSGIGWIFGPPDRRHPGRVRAGAVRRGVLAQAPRGRERRGGRDAVGHPAHRVRDRRAQRPGQARRRRRRRRGRTGRPLGDDDRRALRGVPGHRDRPRRQPGRAGQGIRRHRRGEQRPARPGRTRCWP